MFRTQTFAILGLALASSAALAQPAGNPSGNYSNAPPAQLGPQGQDESYGPPSAQSNNNQAQNNSRDSARDLSCRRDAAARTGYTTPGQAASRANTNSIVGGTVLGAIAGAAIGSASHNAGAGALIGGGAGMMAGAAMGEGNARRAASDVEQDYAAAYYACMDEADGAPPPPREAYGYGPPPPAYYYGPDPYPYPYYAPYYYGPGVSLGFGFGGRSFGGGHGFSGRSFGGSHGFSGRHR